MLIGTFVGLSVRVFLTPHGYEASRIRKRLGGALDRFRDVPAPQLGQLRRKIAAHFSRSQEELEDAKKGKLRPCQEV